MRSDSKARGVMRIDRPGTCRDAGRRTPPNGKTLALLCWKTVNHAGSWKSGTSCQVFDPALLSVRFRSPGQGTGFQIPARSGAAQALVAQLDRASDFESEGREFESLRARQHLVRQTSPQSF